MLFGPTLGWQHLLELALGLRHLSQVLAVPDPELLKRCEAGCLMEQRFKTFCFDKLITICPQLSSEKLEFHPKVSRLFKF